MLVLTSQDKRRNVTGGCRTVNAKAGISQSVSEGREMPSGYRPAAGADWRRQYLRMSVAGYNQIGGFMIKRALAALTALAALAAPARAYAQSATVSPADRSAIQQLLSRYNEALQTCASQQYADLFTIDGTFTSDDFRGAKHRELYGKSAKLAGHDKLVELVETEEFCLNPQQRAARATGRTRSAPSFANLMLQPDGESVRGVLPLASGGRYEDVYVKTSNGWKFKSRNVVMPPVQSK